MAKNSAHGDRCKAPHRLLRCEAVAANAQFNGGSVDGYGRGVLEGQAMPTEPISERGSPRRGWVRHCLLLICIVGACLLHGYNLETKSPTEDEWAHLIRGIAYWSTGQTKLSYAHPPLANAFAAIPVALSSEPPDLTSFEGWDSADLKKITLEYFDTYGYEEARAQLNIARRGILALFIIGIIYVYTWGMRAHNWTTGAIGAVLFAANPIIIGQAQYVTTDLAIGVFGLMVAGELALHIRDRSRASTRISLPLTLCAAIASKHSGILILAVAFAIDGMATYLAARDKTRRSAHLRAWIAQWIASVAIIVLSINTVYRFQDSGMPIREILEKPEPQYWVSTGYEGEMLERRTLFSKLPESTRIPLPYTWIFGVVAVGVQNKYGFPWASFMGMPTPRGHPGYFPTLLAIKLPCGILLLLCAGTILELRRRKPLQADVVLLLFALLLLIASMTSRLNMGVRHILPVVTILTAISGVWAARISTLRNMTLARTITGGACALTIVESIGSRHDHLGHFNLLIGRELGHRISVVGEDWGQDRAEFVSMASTLGITPLYYDAQTEIRRIEVEHLGLVFEDLACDTDPADRSFVALHATRISARREECYPWLDELSPIFHVNHHIYVYWVPSPVSLHEQSERP
jgi:hypothetical protein